jgi:flagellar biosynthesis/type III secretory pathway chaperone
MCEFKRMAMTYEIALELDITKKDVTLRDILGRLPSANREELERAGDSLKNTLETIRSTNLSNHQLLRQSVESIRHELDQFAPAEESGVYTKRGAREESTVRRGGLNLRA